MRSILKSHRRSDSSTSDLSSPLELGQPKPFSMKTATSPLLSLGAFMAPPQPVGSSQSAMSSPKKLLTPIRKMFGHHSKQAPPPVSSADALHSVMFGEFEPPRGRKNFRNPASFSNLSDLRTSDTTTSHNASHTLVLLEAPVGPDLAGSPAAGTPILTFSLTSLDLKAEIRKQKGMAIIPSLGDSGSLGSLPHDGAYLSPTPVYTAKKLDSEVFYEADNDLKDSDASSQFSFVKDVRGGRNTSVKYYKVKLAAPLEQNYFHVDDTGFEDDGLSDYDFENNGMDEEDPEEGYLNANNKYGDFLLDERSDTGLSNPPSPKTSSDNVASTPSLPDVKSPGYDEGLLDSYLEKTRSPNYDAADEPLASLGFLVAESSPFFIPSEQKPGDAVKHEKRGSVANMMDTLMKLESTPDFEIPDTEVAAVVVNPTETQSSNSPKSQNSASAKNTEQRKSVADMMSMLSTLGNQPQDPQPKTAQKDSKRYSWLASDDTPDTPKTSLDEKTYPDSSNVVLSQELIDEINMLPEDYDFNEHVEAETIELPRFFRSSSWKKRPQKVAHDFLYKPQDNKIETHGKTVTFYRSKSLEDRWNLGSSPKRVDSIKSANSFCGEDIDEAEEDKLPLESLRNTLDTLTVPGTTNGMPHLADKD